MTHNHQWEEETGRLARYIEFDTFGQALACVNAIAAEAERQEHHPDIQIYSYKKVKLTLWTDSEQAITAKDHQLASAFDTIIAEHQSRR